MMMDLIGAVPHASRPVWLRAVTVREGDDVVTRCCVVTAGQFHPIEVRVNVPKLIAALRALGLDPGHDRVGGFGSFLKKAVRSVTKSKIIRSVAKVVDKTVSSPVFQVASNIVAPGLGAGLYLGLKGAKAAIKVGDKLIKSKGNPIKVATAIGAGALDYVSPEAAAALGVGLKAVKTAGAGPAIAATAKLVKSNIDLGKKAALAVKQKTVDPKKAKPLIQQAVKARAAVTKLAPALAKQAVASKKVQNQIAAIAKKAKAGSHEAKLAASVLAASHAALKKVDALESKAVGGLPGLLVTAQGRIVRAPKGRFLQSPTAEPGTLYRGKDLPTLKGRFSAVAGASWGGSRDPADDIEGPLYPARHPEGRVMLDDYSAVGVLTP
ncbi:MAG TPA: hypothetical protein VNN80_19135 [Polyangiaceae bacterium]|nr:hypothetical protein [Polyangiaceae bacterium]HWP06533.1 hypothetical protein [Polyangiaceae bacterium]